MRISCAKCKRFYLGKACFLIFVGVGGGAKNCFARGRPLGLRKFCGDPNIHTKAKGPPTEESMIRLYLLRQQRLFANTHKRHAYAYEEAQQRFHAIGRKCDDCWAG